MNRERIGSRRLWGAALLCVVLCVGGALAARKLTAPARTANSPAPARAKVSAARPNAAAPAAPNTQADAIAPANHTPEPGGKIVFASERDGNYEIYTMNQDGGGQTRLTNSPFMDREPAWSPDGTKVAFVSDRDGNTEIYVMNSTGDNNGFIAPTRLTNNTDDDTQPVWSPDGTKIAFVSSRSGNDEIFVMNANGTGQTNLTNNVYDDFEPAWSPNGLKLAFTSTRDFNEEIYTMDATGANAANVSNNAGEDRHPSWGGTKIAFQSTRDGNDEIYIMNQDGAAQTRLTNNAALDQEPWLSTDGTRVAFATNRDNGGVAFEVYVMNATGTGLARLTSNGDDNDFESALQQSAFVAPAPAASTVQFSSAAYTVAEGVGSIQITVTRTGDTTGAAAVDYTATSGTASERSDFATAVGTLRFAAGETSKSFIVFITDDAFAEFDETANLTLSTPTGATLGVPSTTTLTITDNDATSAGANPIDTPEFFVRQHYHRLPEPRA